ncbi:uncharacterized protein EKO05_0002298 [Ascochyta rabiei]|uniref:Uncharacterized protein n=1 Tax=Didymella rabiei TaxID=5454 RepID=A0A163KS38_DIDRA|nr:uncharacterized protein EKO05_0002298 [Ascochyta rabiei]KZM27206.1 hypothetical protein ST47_g1616 [Ascochyta rabiei]UPX11707.1 hypothetical protein EKO05_0002298 [Ascochyta rabiei]
MSHRTAATALLLVSLPYGLALPQIIPVISEVTRVPKPLTLPYEPGYESPTVTVVGTVVDATTDPAALKTVADTESDALPEDALPTLDAVASILPFILPGILPVETDLPPIDTPDVDPSDLPILDPGIGNGTFPDDDLPDTNDLEVIDLPAPSEVPYDDDGIIADPLDPILSDPVPDFLDFPDFPDFSDFPDEKTVPIGTFNAVIQPLVSVIQTLLNALPGNFAPPLPSIFIHPLLPTETPDIFIDPLLPTETFDDAIVATATDAIDSLLDSLFDSIPSIADSVATDLPFAKRQLPDESDESGIRALIGPILDAIKELIAQIPGLGPAVADAVSDIEEVVPSVVDQLVDVPAVDTQLPIPTFTIPAALLPTLPADLPIDVPAIPELPSPEITLPSLPTDVPVPPVEAPDVTSAIPDEVLDVPIPDIEGIDWSQYESPPFSPFSDLPTPSTDDLPIPDDVLNVPVPDFDEFGVPIDSPLDASDLPVAIPSLALPTSLDVPGVDGSGVPLDAPLDAVSDLSSAPSVLPALLDWPFDDFEIPNTLAPDATGELPDLSDLPISSSALSVPVPDSNDLGVPLDLATVAPALPTDAVGGLLLPASLPALTILPEITILPDLPVPTGLFDVPVPGGFEDLGDLPAPTGVASSLPLPTLEDLAIPTDILNIPVPDLDQFGVPIDLPVDSNADLPLPTNFLDVPVPEGFENLGEALDLPDPTLPTDVVPDFEDFPIPDAVLNIPVPDLDNLDVPLDLSTDPIAAFPTSLFDVPVPEGFEDLGEPFDLPAATLPADVVPDVQNPAVPTDVLNIPVPNLDDLGVPVEQPSILPAFVQPSILPAFEQPSILPAFEQPSILPAPVQPSILPAPALSEAAFGAGFPIQVLPDVPLVLPSAPTDALPTLPTDALPVSEAPADPTIPALPVVPTLQGIVPSGVSTAPAIPVVAVVPAIPTLQGIVPKLPFQLPGQARPLAKREMMAAQAAQVSSAKIPIGSGIALALTKSLLTLVRALLDTLPIVGKTVPNLGASLPAVPTILPALPTVPVIPGVPGVNSIVPSPSLPAVPDVAGALTPVISILPLPTATDLASAIPALPTLPDVADVASALPPVSDVSAAASTVTGAVSAVPGISEVLSTVSDVPKVPLAFDSGLERRRLPLARRATEFQQGSASEWESFLGELDESKQEELHELIHDSAAAVTHNDMDNLASKLQADFEDLSDASKARLLNGWVPGSVLTAVQERSMRNGKRQAAVPGAQSIGPDLDDAQKVDLSGILGEAGTLDPFNQLVQSGPGKFVDEVLTPSQAVSSYGQLDDDSVDPGLNPELSVILGAAGTLDPNGMLSSHVGMPGSVVDGADDENPYTDILPSWDPAFQDGTLETLPGLEATLQAAQENHVGAKAPKLPFAPQPAGSAAAAQAQAIEQGSVLKWFNGFVRPSGRSDVDATLVQ